MQYGGIYLKRGRAEAARQAHNLKVAGSNPAPATKLRPFGASFGRPNYAKASFGRPSKTLLKRSFNLKLVT
jgi:hypothetical protein